MSAAGLDADDVDVTSSPRYEDLRVSDHVHIRWAERSSHSRLNPRVAWLEAIPIDYPSMSPPAKHARLHEVSEMILLADDYELITCIPLTDRPQDEQQHIRDQIGL